jgi:putative transposase
VLDRPALDWLKAHFAKLSEQVSCTMLACDGAADHVHLLVEYPPKHSISILVNTLKGTSSRMLHKLRPDIAHHYRDGVLWSPSYLAASTGGASLETVKRYVEQQRASSSP